MVEGFGTRACAGVADGPFGSGATRDLGESFIKAIRVNAYKLAGRGRSRGRGTRLLRDGESDRCASCQEQGKVFADDVDSRDGFFGEVSIGLEYELNRLFKCFALRIGAGEFFDKGDVAFGDLLEHGGEVNTDSV